MADDVNAYISRAVDLARGDRLELNRLRTTMRARLRQPPLCDTRAFAASMEDLYGEMCTKINRTPFCL